MSGGGTGVHPAGGHACRVSVARTLASAGTLSIDVLGSIRGDGFFVQADADPELEVLFVSPNGSKLIYLLNHDGTHEPGWPRFIPTAAEARPASFGDLDGDGVGEIVVASDFNPNGSLAYTNAYHVDGSVVSGFPVLTNGDSGNVTVVDLDGDNRCEIIAHEHGPGSTGKLYLIGGDGTVRSGWPVTLDYYPATSAAAGDLDGDGIKEIVYASGLSLFAWHLDGTLVSGFPFTPGGGVKFWASDPVMADIDGDNLHEIAIGAYLPNNDGLTYLIGPTGTPLPGWPYQTNHRIWSVPTFADLDGDGDLELIAAETASSICPTGYLYAWHTDASLVDGFPYGQVHAVNSQIAVGDIDGDSLPELIWDDDLTTDGVGWLNACHADGTPLAGWRLTFVGTPVFNTPALADADLDGDVELLIATGPPGQQGATIFLWDMPGDPTTIQASMPQYGPGRDGLYRGPAVVAVGASIPTPPLRLSAHPNPFNPSVTLSYEISAPGRVRVAIYDVSGRLVRRFVERGDWTTHGQVSWTGRDETDAPVSSGTYVVRIESAGGSVATSVVLVR